MSTADVPEAEIAERTEEDDYDLLTYSEAAVRLAELLQSERDRLAELQAAPTPDPATIDALQKRIELLAASDARYKGYSSSADKFIKTFGFDPRGSHS